MRGQWRLPYDWSAAECSFAVSKGIACLSQLVYGGIHEVESYVQVTVIPVANVCSHTVTVDSALLASAGQA